MTEYNEYPKPETTPTDAHGMADKLVESVKPYAEKVAETVKPYADKAAEAVKPYADKTVAMAKEQAAKVDMSKLQMARVDLHLARLDIRDDVKSIAHDTAVRGEALAKDVKRSVDSTVKLVREAVGI